MFREKIIRETEKLASRNDRILVCVSGGIDSVVLLDILKKGGWNVSVAHCNFALRGEESDGDEAFVRNLCSMYGVEGHFVKFETERYAKENGLNTQIAARELRYRYFFEIKDSFGYDRIAVAHHLDDSIETFFINLMRGTGLKGISGISAERNGIIRPMLGATRAEINAYAEENGLCHREDRTNGEDHYLRNRIRHHVVPLIEQLSPSFRTVMAGNLERLSQAAGLLERTVSAKVASLKTGPGTFDLRTLASDPDRSLVLFGMLHPLGFNPDVISQLEKSFIEGSCGKRFVGDGKCAFLERDRLKIVTSEEPERSHSTVYRESAELIPADKAGDIRHTPKDTAYLDADKLKFPLEIRTWKPGDRIQPLGMRGSKTVGDFLTDRKVPLSDRNSVRVVADADGKIAWIVGMQISETFKVDSDTKTVIKL